MRHFKAWYPQFGSRLHAIMLANCSQQLRYYQISPPPYNHCHNCQAATVQTCLADAPTWMRENMAIGVGCMAEAVETCILGNAPEWMKANMAAASVLLGLLPTIISLAGSSTAETGFLAQRRPLLALLLAAGSPTVSPMRAFEYQGPEKLLDKKPDTIELRGILDGRATWKRAIIAVQYMFAIGAVVNVAHTSWQLGVQTLCSFSTETTFHPLLWAFVSVFLHVLGAQSVQLRISLVELPASTSLKGLRKTISKEFNLSIHQARGRLVFKQESFAFICTSWCISIGTILHLLYGTIAFSSIVFISTQDALFVAFRYFLSTIVCRVILMFEIAGMRVALDGEGGAHEPRPLVNGPVSGSSAPSSSEGLPQKLARLTQNLDPAS